MSYSIILGSIIGISLIGVIISFKKQHDHTVAKNMIAVFSLIILICAVLLTIHRLVPPSVNKIVNNKLIFVKSSGYKLAKYLSKQKSGSQILVLTDKANRNSPACKAVIEGLEEGLDGSWKKLIVLSPPHSVVPKDQNSIPHRCIINAKDLNNILKRYPKSRMLVSLIGLPDDIEDLDILKKFISTHSNLPRVALLNCKVRNMYNLMKGGFIGAVVFPNPKTKYNNNSPEKDLMKNFDMHYLFITKENMDQIAKDFPGRIFSQSASNHKK